MKKCLILVTNKLFLDNTLQTINQITTKGNYKDEIVRIALLGK
jgi:hypothetical protein